MNIWKKVGIAALALSTLLGLSACNDDKHAMYALTSTGKLIGFQSDTPTDLTSSVSITGLSSGESIMQIDYRPSTGALYGFTTDNRLVTIDPGSGATTAVASSGYTDTTLTTPLISFDPVFDLMRVIATNANQLVTPGTGVLYSTGTVVDFDNSDTNSDKSPQLAAITYSNHKSGVTTTTLYALDVTTHSLLRVGNADATSTSSVNAGLLHTIGDVGFAFSANAGLTTLPSSGDGYAALAQGSAVSVLYKIDLGSGGLTKVGTIGDGVTIISLTATP
jgi:hypothetical protein